MYLVGYIIIGRPESGMSEDGGLRIISYGERPVESNSYRYSSQFASFCVYVKFNGALPPGHPPSEDKMCGPAFGYLKFSSYR